ncbi:hypothetical protein HK101_010573 [Irineochytrium annulatum]|nr:hypothetical protein HK101_010573 [Irineochytrium annulatum]
MKEAHLLTEFGVQKQIDVNKETVSNLSIVSRALTELNELSREEGGIAAWVRGGLAWRWKIYLGSVRTLKIKPASTSPFLNATSLSPWLKEVTRLEVSNKVFTPSCSDWHSWLNTRWCSGQVPETLELVGPVWDEVEAKKLLGHVAVSNVTLRRITPSILRNILAAIRHKLRSIKVVGRSQHSSSEAMEILRDYKYGPRGDNLRAIRLTFGGIMEDIPQGLPVACLHLNEFTVINGFDMTAAKDSLVSLHVQKASMLPMLSSSLSQMQVLHTIKLDIQHDHCISYVFRPLYGLLSLRNLTLAMPDVHWQFAMKHLKTFAQTLPYLTKLSLSIVVGDADFDPFVKALPWLQILKLKVAKGQGERHVSFPRGLKKLTLIGVTLVVNLRMVKMDGLPSLVHIRVDGGIVNGMGRPVDAEFMNLLKDAEIAPRICLVKFGAEVYQRY